MIIGGVFCVLRNVIKCSAGFRSFNGGYQERSVEREKRENIKKEKNDKEEERKEEKRQLRRDYT